MIKKAYLILSFCSLFAISCSPTKRLAEGEVLLNKNKIHTDVKEYKDDISVILKQKQNRRILWVFRFHLGVYNLWSGGKKDTRFKKWMRETIGEAPVILDTVKVQKSSEQISLFMHNMGYFKAETSDTIVMKGKKKANVNYYIRSGKPYTINEMAIHCEDPYVYSITMADRNKTLLKRGVRYDTELLQSERKRVTENLKRQGYYEFNENYIRFNVDSSLQSYQVNLYMIIERPISDTSDTVYTNHRSYFINNIYIRTNHDPLGKSQRISEDTVSYEDFRIISTPNNNRFKPSLLSQHTFIRKGEFYNREHVGDTYRRIADLGVFKFINIKYEKSPTIFNQRLLNCFINLTPRAKQDYSIELEGTHNGGNLGIATNFVYRNKNTFGGAELLEVKIKGAAEYQRQFLDSSFASEPKIAFFNTYEFGPEINLIFPKFLLPVNLRNISKKANPVTRMQSSYNIQVRPEFTRRIANLSFGYSWKESQFKRHEVFPFEFNYVDVTLNEAFKRRIESTGDPSLINSYNDQLITNGRYSYTYSNQRLKVFRDFWFFRFNFEIAGNSIYLFDKLFESEKDSSSRRFTKLNNIPYAQYIKPDVDLRFYQVFSEHSSVIYRIAGGIGITYGNSSNARLPYEKSFYGGGANDMRAWRARTLGPGSYDNSFNLEQFGEIKINTNIEYRFKIVSLLNGAMFVDAGNIWLRQEDPNRENAEFDINNLYDDLAVGAGFGFRLDFNFFILRLDPAIRIKDPADDDNHWFQTPLAFRNMEFNLGIGYPF